MSNQNATVPPRRNYHQIPSDQLGLRIVGRQPDSPTVDIVAVHGLGATPDLSWKASGARQDWLEDPQMLPAVVPGARVLRFGYDSLWYGPNPAKSSLETIAASLLRGLDAKREDCKDRPILFIGHCFGGLVIQKALVDDALVNRHSLLDCCVGTVFLGTPHRGTDIFNKQGDLLAAIAEAASQVEGATIRFEPDVLEELRKSGDGLTETSANFVKLFGTSEHLRVACFHEQRRSPIGRLVQSFSEADIQDAYMVTAESARFDVFISIPLSGDHFQMHKFSDPEDGNYQSVSQQIRRFCSEGLQVRRSDHSALPGWKSMKRFASSNTRTPFEMLLKAICNKNESEIQRLLGKDINLVNRADPGFESWRPLHVATKDGFYEAVLLLLGQGANVNAKTDDGFTPLHIAVSNGDVQVVETLLQFGADMTMSRPGGITVLHNAARKGLTEIVQILLDEEDVDLILDVETDDRLTAWDLAGEGNHVEVLQLLEGTK